MDVKGGDILLAKVDAMVKALDPTKFEPTMKLGYAGDIPNAIAEKESIVSEAALAFVGLGPRDGVSLGGVLDQGVASMLRAPHILAVGAAAVFATSAAMLAAGRALGDLRS